MNNELKPIKDYYFSKYCISIQHWLFLPEAKALVLVYRNKKFPLQLVVVGIIRQQKRIKACMRSW